MINFYLFTVKWLSFVNAWTGRRFQSPNWLHDLWLRWFPKLLRWFSVCRYESTFPIIKVVIRLANSNRGNGSREIFDRDSSNLCNIWPDPSKLNLRLCLGVWLSRPSSNPANARDGTGGGLLFHSSRIVLCLELDLSLLGRSQQWPAGFADAQCATLTGRKPGRCSTLALWKLPVQPFGG